MTPRDRKLSIKDVVTIVGLLSFVGGFYLWANSQVLVPSILEQTRAQTGAMLEKHESGVHAGSFSHREFRLWSEQLFKRLDSIENAVKR